MVVAFEIIFMLVILKIPIVYLCIVVWYAIKAEPTPPEPTEAIVVDDTPPADHPWRPRSKRPRPPRPHTNPRAFPTGPHRGGVHA
jgi:hypothetical protein